MKKTLSVLIAMLITLLGFSLPASDASDIAVNSALIVSGTAIVNLSGAEGETVEVYAANFDSVGRLQNVVRTSAVLTGTAQTLMQSGVENGALLFIWNRTQAPLNEAQSFTDEAGFTATFTADDYATVTVYPTQEAVNGVTGAATAVARSSDTGLPDTTGEGQINFSVSAEEGYRIVSVTAEPTTNYKNLKTVDAASGLYRITKVTGDITVTVTTAEIGEEQGDGIIHLCGTSIDATGVVGATVDGSTLLISQAGTYTIEGTLTDGQIIVTTGAKTDEVILNLQSVNVTSTSGNALDATKGKVTIANSGESTFKATLTDCAAICSKNDLVIKGSGTLTAISEAGNGIHCKADLEIGSGDIHVTAYHHGIKGNDSVKITKKAGTITVTAQTGDALKTDAIDEETLTMEYGKGNVTVNGGTLTLTAPAGDGIQADDTVTIAGGTTTIVSGTEGIKSTTVNTPAIDETTGATMTMEGSFVMTGGTVNITTQEDGIKAAKIVRIAGGDLTITVETDGIQSGVDYTDSNNQTQYSQGDLTISGGTLSIIAGGGSTNRRTDEDSHKGIKAYHELTVTGGTITADCYDDTVHSNYITTVIGGDLTLASADDGLHADYKLIMGTTGGSDSDYTVNITTSYEGLEGSVIDYLSGTTYLYATDDGVNAAGDYDENGVDHSSESTGGGSSGRGPGGGPGGRPGGPGSWGGGPGWGMDDSAKYGMLYIRGGMLYVVAKGDGLDSNGNIVVSGGVTVVNGTTSGGNGVFDKGDNNNTFTVTGGTLIGFGTTDMADNPSSVTGQGYFSTTGISITKGTALKVTTDNGYIAVVPEITLSRGLLYVTCPDMTQGRTYSKSSSTDVSDGTRILGRTVGSTWYGLYQK